MYVDDNMSLEEAREWAEDIEARLEDPSDYDAQLSAVREQLEMDLEDLRDRYERLEAEKEEHDQPVSDWRSRRADNHRRKLGLLLSTTGREYVVAYVADNGNVCVIRTINTPTVLREYAEKDAEAMRSLEDQTEVFVAYRDTPMWQRATAED